eukprot:CAMPEP_0201501916 /NCGR_PEP_ID=MMETSP0151_2-20130828/83849_1 /ASSEMBLY_ACC=CAM_ASM_000257 /TAXON_ID=200890 /ORGANISM="Paramoeba atlantica, Strain 621/1 / CCAP 1560/9" /LENGTH=64 /DNA_ID=CAMNT_0047895467 /DNA_START=2252 /DNA_END=2446 /DNA_ORIENTATION=-
MPDDSDGVVFDCSNSRMLLEENLEERENEKEKEREKEKEKVGDYTMRAEYVLKLIEWMERHDPF